MVYFASNFRHMFTYSCIYMDLHGWLGTVKEPIEFDNIQPQNDHVVLILVSDLSSHHVWSREGLKKL